MLSSKFHNNLHNLSMNPPHIQHPCRNSMVETALDKLHSDEHSCIVLLCTVLRVFAESYGPFHLLIPSFAILYLLFKHHKDFSSDNLHLLASGLQELQVALLQVFRASAMGQHVSYPMYLNRIFHIFYLAIIIFLFLMTSVSFPP